MFYIKKLLYIKKTRAQFLFGDVLKLSPRVSGITKESTSWIYYTQFSMGNVAKLRQIGVSTEFFFFFPSLYISFGISFCLLPFRGRRGAR